LCFLSSPFCNISEVVGLYFLIMSFSYDNDFDIRHFFIILVYIQKQDLSNAGQS